MKKCRGKRRAGGGQGLSWQGRTQRTPGLPRLPPQRRSPIQGRQPGVAQRSRRGTRGRPSNTTALPHAKASPLERTTLGKGHRATRSQYGNERGALEAGAQPVTRDPRVAQVAVPGEGSHGHGRPRALTAPASPAGAATASMMPSSPSLLPRTARLRQLPRKGHP